MTHPATRKPPEDRRDADPVIDALLAEFVPGDVGRRSSPPDLSAKILQRLASPDCEPEPEKDYAAFEDADPLIDVLLAEFVPAVPEKRSSPPDLSAEILRRLASSRSGVDELDGDPVIDALLPEFVPASPRKRRVPPNLTEEIVNQLPNSASPNSAKSTTDSTTLPERSRPLGRMLTLIAALAASIAVMIWLSGQRDGQDDVAARNPESMLGGLSGQDSDPSRGIDRQDNSTRVESGLAVDESTLSPDETEPLRGIPMDSPSVVVDSATDPIDRPTVDLDPDAVKPSTPVTLVAAKSNQTVREYWEKLGITPTPDASAELIASRLKARLGVELSAESLSDPKRLRDDLAKPSNANEIAKRWLALNSDSSVAALQRPVNAGLVNELAEGVSGRSKFDVTLVSLIDGSSPHSQLWYETIGRGGTEKIAKNLARLSFNADLRCVRCHDSHIGRSGTQDDYWSFVALVRNGIKRVDDRWTISDRPESNPAFFELLDGRQRMASPKVSQYLRESDEEIKSFSDWANTLADSDALSGSIVDSLWQLVHGRRLKPSPVDAFAPPVDESLNRLHGLLADDLKANRFDVARTLALIISSPTARRSVPEALRGDALLTTREEQRAEALELVGAFAAAVEPPQSSLQQRIDVAMRRIGGRLLDSDHQTMLAQPIEGKLRDPNASRSNIPTKPVLSLQQRLAVDFPGNDASLPVSWLRSIDDFDLQVQHLVYLSGRGRVNPEIIDAANRLREAGTRESALSRIWWILRDRDL